jgi:HD-like signal output (HDOD) protein
MEEQKKFDHELEQAVLNLGIPPCPEILLDLAEEARKEEPDLQRIEKLICADVGLSAALIKTINSPFYGLRNKVNSVMQAIHMLGMSQLSLMVMSMVLRDVLKGISHVEMARFWDVSSKVAIISSYISCRLPSIGSAAHKSRQIFKDEAYTYGLFQDCGIPIMLNHYATYKEILSVANQSADKIFTAVEDAEHGNNHAMIGYLMARSWGLPVKMTEAIRFHHEHLRLDADKSFISNESRDFVAVTLLAERAVQLITGRNQTCEWQKGRQWVMQHFGFSEDDLNAMMDGIRILHEEGNLDVG